MYLFGAAGPTPVSVEFRATTAYAQVARGLTLTSRYTIRSAEQNWQHPDSSGWSSPPSVGVLNSPLCHTRHRMISLTTTGQDIAGFCVPANHKHFVPLYYSRKTTETRFSGFTFIRLHQSSPVTVGIFFERLLSIQNASNRNNPLQSPHNA